MIEALQSIYDWLVNGSYTFIQEIVAAVMIWGITLWFKFKVAALAFMWGVASSMIDQLGLSALINQFWGELNNSFVGFLTRYNIPEALNLVLNARITRFIWNMI